MYCLGHHHIAATRHNFEMRGHDLRDLLALPLYSRVAPIIHCLSCSVDQCDYSGLSRSVQTNGSQYAAGLSPAACSKPFLGRMRKQSPIELHGWTYACVNYLTHIRSAFVRLPIHLSIRPNRRSPARLTDRLSDVNNRLCACPTVRPLGCASIEPSK